MIIFEVLNLLVNGDGWEVNYWSVVIKYQFLCGHQQLLESNAPASLVESESRVQYIPSSTTVFLTIKDSE